MSLRTSLQKLIRRDPAASLREQRAATAARVEAFKPATAGAALGSPTDLAQACDQAVVNWNAIQPRSQAEDWSDEQISEAMDAYAAVFQQAIVEPSHNLPEVQAKARLLLHDLIANTTGHDPGDETTLLEDDRLTRVVLREIIGLSDTAALTDLTDWQAPPPGFMASPAIEPTHFALIPHALRVELDRLHCIAQREFDRRVGSDPAPERRERLRRLLKLDIFEAASLSGDAEILALGVELDGVHARWRASVPAYNAAQARLSQSERDARAQGKDALAANEAAWDEPGVREAIGLFEDICAELDPLCRKIWSTPARTPLGLAVKARASLVMIFACGEYEAGCNLGEDEDLTEQSARHLIEACCAFAGVDWKGELTDGTTLSVPFTSQDRATPGLVSLVDFASASLEDLQSLRDIADQVGGVAYATVWTGRCKARGLGDYPNAAGKLMQWLGDALTDVETAANAEARRRSPTAPIDREKRFQILALPVLQNGDPDETEAFAHELLAHVEAERRGR